MAGIQLEWFQSPFVTPFFYMSWDLLEVLSHFCTGSPFGAKILDIYILVHARKENDETSQHGI